MIKNTINTFFENFVLYLFKAALYELAVSTTSKIQTYLPTQPSITYIPSLSPRELVSITSAQVLHKDVLFHAPLCHPALLSAFHLR